MSHADEPEPRQPAPDKPDDDPFEEWDRHPVDEAEENIGYQKLAWYSAPFGDTGVAVVALAFVVNLARRLVRAGVRLVMR